MNSAPSPGKPHDCYLAWGDGSVTLSELDRIYGEIDESSRSRPSKRSGTGKPRIFASMGEQKIEAYYGSPPDPGVYTRKPQDFNLGVRGRIWCLCLLISNFATENFVSAPQLAESIASETKTRWLDLREKWRTEIKDVRDQKKLPSDAGWQHYVSDSLHQLISEHQKEACPPAEIADDLLALVADFCRKRIFERDADWKADLENLTRLDAVLSKNCSRPSEFYRLLGELCPPLDRPHERGAPTLPEIPKTDIDRLAGVSYVDRSLDRGVFLAAAENAQARIAAIEDGDESDLAVNAILGALRDRDPSAPRIVMLWGPLSSGRKTKICRFLRVIGRGQRLLFEQTSPTGRVEAQLPICALSAKNYRYPALVAEIVHFLRKYESIQKQIQNQGARFEDYVRPAAVERMTLQELLAEVTRLHEGRPAIFIFADADAIHADYSRKVVRDIGIIRLLVELTSSNPDSFAILTTTAAVDPTDPFTRRLPMPRSKPIKIEGPVLSDVLDFVSDDIKPQLTKLQSLFTHIRSDDLQALVALLQLTDDVPSVVDILTRFRSKTSEDEKDAIWRSIYQALVSQIDKRGLLAPVSLIAATDDGLRPDSLFRLLRIWSPYNTAAKTTLEMGDLDRHLAELAKTCGKNFLLKSRMARYDPEEYGFHEQHAPDDQVWEMDALLSETLLSVLQTSHPDIARQASRLIAKLARERAQIKKTMARSPVGARASEDASRDIQCFVSLLSSIGPEDLEEVGNEPGPLRLNERAVFSLDPKTFSGRHALRFAVTCLLREDIDHDHRLTMIYDEDGLRLDLYLRLFNELGRRYHTLLGAIKLPKSLPQHFLQGIFSDEQVLELMNTVALSAYHAQRFDVVSDVARLAQDFCNEREVPDFPDKLIRIWCSQIDTWILKGGVSEDRGRRNHLETLADVQRVRRANFDLVEKALRLADGESLPGSARTLKAGMRLLAREAELQAITNEDREVPMALYRDLENLERYWACKYREHDPAVLSGRVARRYIKFLLRDPLFRDGEDTSRDRRELTAKIWALIDANVARLRRFSGADRVGVMLDTARLYAALGKIEVATKWAEEASNTAFSGNVSSAGKLDVLKVNAYLHIRLAEQRIREGASIEVADEILREAETETGQLEFIAENLSALSHLEYAHVYRGRMIALAAILRRNAPRALRRALGEAGDKIRRADEELRRLSDRSFDSVIAESLASAEGGAIVQVLHP